jgi:hypothetical protein
VLARQGQDSCILSPQYVDYDTPYDSPGVATRVMLVGLTVGAAPRCEGVRREGGTGDRLGGAGHELHGVQLHCAEEQK